MSDRAFLAALLVLATALIGVTTILPARRKRQALEERERTLAEEVSTLEARSSRLRARAIALRDDPFAIERALRRRYGALRPGESRLKD